MPSGIEINLKSKQFSRLIRMPMCEICQYDKKCAEGYYAVRINGLGHIYPCILSPFKTEITKSMENDNINDKFITVFKHVFRTDYLSINNKTWLDYLDAYSYKEAVINYL